MLFESVYMIRGGAIGAGPFGTNFITKILLVTITLIIVIYDWRKKERLDYLWVFIVGSLIWTWVEAYMQLTGQREFNANYLFYYEIPLFISIPIQGMAEGAAVAVICLFFGDRMLDEETRKKTAIAFTVLMVLLFLSSFSEGIQTPNYGGDVPSRREMYKISSIIFLSTMIIATIIFFFVKPKPEQRMRGLYLLILMIIFGTVWTLGEFLAGTRWIEVGTEGNTRHAPPLIEFASLAFDVLIEIAVAYVPFFSIPVWLGLIKSE